MLNGNKSKTSHRGRTVFDPTLRMERRAVQLAKRAKAERRAVNAKLSQGQYD